MKRLRLLPVLFLFLIPTLQLAAQGVSLPDASQKVKSLPQRSGQGPSKVPAAQAQAYDPATRMDWWRDARFGMFIHWGLYAVPAGEWNGKTNYGEWIRTSAEIPLDTYDRFRTRFNPVKFDADAWVKMAKDAGMKYIVITSKHHDGFCMFETKNTDFNIMNTPFRHDPMTDLAAACKKYGLKFCFYHSIMDWHHPDYLPRRDWEKDRPTAGADFDKYVAYMKAELKELLTNYGDIGVLWFDGEWENTWNEKYGKDLYAYVRSLQPPILINNRVGAGRLDMEGLTKAGAFGGDFGTPEQQIPATGLPGVDWETCMTMNDHWGYNRADKNFKSTSELIRMLTDIASKGGNYLLNVGPTDEGLIPQESIERLATIGKWMKVNSQAIYGTTASPFKSLPWGRCTQKQAGSETILYLHVFAWPTTGQLEISGVLNQPAKAFLLADPDSTPLVVKRDGETLIIKLPGKCPDTVNSVVALVLKGKLDITNPPDFETQPELFVDSLDVVFRSDRENVEIRYTTGSVVPELKSALYTKPVRIRTTTQLNIRCFRDGKPVSGTATKTYTKAVPLKADHPGSAGDASKAGITYRYYEGAFDSLPDFHSLKPLKTGIVADFTFDPRNVPDLFAFEYSGYINIPETDVYTFYTGSDDGSRLWVDNRLVVDNDGLHGLQEKQGFIALEKGWHPIRVGFFERTGSDNLTVYISSRKMPKAVLPKAWLQAE